MSIQKLTEMARAVGQISYAQFDAATEEIYDHEDWEAASAGPGIQLDIKGVRVTVWYHNGNTYFDISEDFQNGGGFVTKGLKVPVHRLAKFLAKEFESSDDDYF